MNFLNLLAYGTFICENGKFVKKFTGVPSGLSVQIFIPNTLLLR